MTDLPASYVHCATLLREEDRDAWLAALLAPAEARPHLHALGAFALEVGRVRGRVTQAIAGEIRLQWWQDVVDGERTAEAAAHPVAAALADTIARVGLPRAFFGDMLDAFRIALYDEPPADLAALERRLIASHATPIRLAARVLGGGPAIDPAADDAGIALGIADILDELRSGQRPPLPALLLSPGPTAAVAALRAMARERLRKLREDRKGLGEAGAAFLRAALVEPRLRSGEATADPLAPVPEMPQWRRQWRMWRAARHGGAL